MKVKEAIEELSEMDENLEIMMLVNGELVPAQLFGSMVDTDEGEIDFVMVEEE